MVGLLFKTKTFSRSMMTKKLVECITEKSYWQTLLYSAFFATNREVEKTCCGRVKNRFKIATLSGENDGHIMISLWKFFPANCFSWPKN